MKDKLSPGLTFQFTYTVPKDKTVRCLLPESPEFQLMPEMLATGFMVGLIEWTCIQAVNPHIDWPREQTVGIGINVTHTAATPPGLTVTVKVKLVKVDGRKLTFSVAADDGMDTISRGIHERFLIDAAKFDAKVFQKIRSVGKEREILSLSSPCQAPPGKACSPGSARNQRNDSSLPVCGKLEAGASSQAFPGGAWERDQ